MMEAERKALLNALAYDRVSIEAAMNTTFNRIPKSVEASEKARLEGNALYSRRGDHDERTHVQIFSHYCKSIALAPCGSETLALAYGNRSAFLLHIKKYKESVEDIDRALRIICTSELKVKLLCRKVECLKAMGCGGYKRAMNEAEKYLEKISEEHAKRGELEKLLNRVKEMRVSKAKNVNGKDIRSEAMEVLSKKEMSSVREAVDIKYNKKYGRHLVAAKDFQPGDIIFVEKIYITFLNSRKNYTNCCYCLKICWSGVPCDYCGWAMFCSVECKGKAWKEYHDIECSVYPLLSVLDGNLMHSYRICIRMMIKGIKEAGDISKLKAQLESIDQCSGEVYRGFMENETFVYNTFKTIYTLNSDLIEGRNSFLKLFANTAVMVLICLMKSTSLFGKNFKMSKIEDIMNDKDAIFLGSLFIKLCKIKKINSHAFAEVMHECEQLNDLTTCKKNKCCDRGVSLTPLASLINHSCFPNASRCFTEDQKIVFYALQPIKKNSQIFDSYNLIFYHGSIVERQKEMEGYNFICDCIACVENWPPLFTQPRYQKHLKPDVQEITIYTPQSTYENKLFESCKGIFKALDDGKNNFDQKTIKKLSKTIIKATSNLVQPNEVFCLLIEALNEIFPKIFGIRHESFGNCKNA